MTWGWSPSVCGLRPHVALACSSQCDANPRHPEEGQPFHCVQKTSAGTYVEWCRMPGIGVL